jgi:hypothetical protein
MPEMDLHWPSEIGLQFVWSQIFAYMLWPHNAVKRRAHVIGGIALMLGELDYPPYLRNHDWPNLSVMLESHQRVHGGEQREARALFGKLGGFPALEHALVKPPESFPVAELMTVGFVFETLYSINVHHPELRGGASVKKAAFLIESTYRGRGLVDNERDIRKAWSKYKDISHLAASLRMMVGDEYLWGQRSLEGLSIFLAIAKDLENFGVSFYPHARDLALLDSKKVWSVPKRLPLRLPQLTGPAAPPIPDRDLAVLQDYRA